jgi:FkbM family methyltransferase
MAVESAITVSFGGTSRPFYLRRKTSDEAVVRQIFVNREYDFTRLRRAAELTDLVKRGAASGRHPLIVDAGANVGATALYFAMMVPTARVVAIEPEPENFRLLGKNVAGLDVETVHGAIASAAGHARLIDPGEGHWGYRIENASDGEAGSVPLVTINAIFSANSARYFPLIVKIDIEGGERDLFSANTEWLARTPLVIIELQDWLLPRQGVARPFLARIAELDRDFITLGENVFSLANDLDATPL